MTTSKKRKSETEAAALARENVEMSQVDDEKQILPVGFHQAGNEPLVIMDASKEIAICVSIRAIPFVDNDGSYYNHFAIYTTGSGESAVRKGFCLLCPASKTIEERTKLCGTNKGNLKHHIAAEHKEWVPFEDLNADAKKKWSKAWQDMMDSDRDLKSSSVKTIKVRLNAAQRELLGSNAVNDPHAATSPLLVSLAKMASARNVRDVLLRAVVLGHLPIAYVENAGLQYLLRKAFGSLKGVSPRTVKRDLEVAYNDIRGMVQKEWQRLLASGMPSKGRISIMHDGWSTKKHGFLGVQCRIMDVTVNPWRIATITAGCFPFRGSHSAQAALSLIKKEFCEKFGVDLSSIGVSTQDSTYSSANVFTPVEHIYQLNCFCHTLMLLLKWSHENSAKVKEAFAAIHDLNAFLLGSTKRTDVVFSVQKTGGVKHPVAPRLEGETRWNGFQDMLAATIRYFPHLKNVKAEEIYPSPTTEQERNWARLLRQATKALEILTELNPYLVLII
jgi:hypothetical protein